MCPATSITPPHTLSNSSDSLETTDDQTTPKLSRSLPQPQLTITQNGEPSSTMAPPRSIVRPSNANSTLALSISTLPPQKRPRQKVILAPGHSPLDWARLKSSGIDLRVAYPPQPHVLTF